ncbi:hypothetical protein SH580_00150 [Coraliomargarita algicola]|uniref:Uncharacterized protein n=1 Tax=Coraliomargarita algicola TaxID=3092156 RepID=A0ABZ0RT13_9BACT|nr:hypothetical protein [Coraliomargarita sp. J2-16]WPJ96109.1 hypothetical protein SH580_00150 [Coraliomargarita sp. J2-16]
MSFAFNFDKVFKTFLLCTLTVGGAQLGAETSLALNGDIPPPQVKLPANPLVFPEEFNWEIGLWKQTRAGHTRPVANLKETHSGRVAANRLFVANYLGAMEPKQSTRILKALRELQVTDGSARHGCMQTYYEEDRPVDTNASFFIGLQLIALERTASQRLEPEAQVLLKDILADLAVWFRHEAKQRSYYYPNKYMGDLVCAWLLQEDVSATDADARQLLDIMEEAARYWADENWGWGEHMSDNYGPLLVEQLSTLLLFQRHLPDEVYAMYKQLFDELNTIAYMYRDGPRVPVIRSYFGTRKPDLPQYHTNIMPVSAQSRENVEKLARGDVRIAQGDLFYRLGWRELVNVQSKRRDYFEIPCYDGAVAHSWVTDDARLGTMSRYPIMANTDQMGWGLSWQTMPLAFATSGDGWGFARWTSREGDKVRSHPAGSHRGGYLDTVLSSAVNYPIVGETYGLQQGPDALVARMMPAVATAWNELSDEIVFTGSDFSVIEENLDGDVPRLIVKAGEDILTVQYLALSHRAQPQVYQEGKQFSWRVSWDQEDLKARPYVAGAWILSWGREVAPVPSAKQIKVRGIPSGVAWQMDWPLPDGRKAVEFSHAKETTLKLVPAQ